MRREAARVGLRALAAAANASPAPTATQILLRLRLLALPLRTGLIQDQVGLLRSPMRRARALLAGGAPRNPAARRPRRQRRLLPPGLLRL